MRLDPSAVSALLLTAAAVCCAAGAFAADSRHDGAFLVFSRTLSGDLVQGVNITIAYEIHNVGQADATNVRLRDVAFPASRFIMHTGSFRPSWPRLNAGQSVVMEVIVEPKRAGELIVSPASLSYKDGDVPRTMRLATSDDIVVEDLLVYRRRTATHHAAWLTYACASAAAIGVPYFSYTRAIGSIPAGKKRA